jgi:transcriptional regulator with XRE-family HTH domain
MTNSRNALASLLSSKPSDPDLQAGSLGLSPQDVVGRYLKSPGQLLAILRTVRGIKIVDVAKATKIEATVLEKYESGDVEPGPQEMVALAKFFGADLRTFMQAIGSIRDDAAEDSMGIAAHFAGELSEEERLDLRALVGVFAAGRRGKRTE